jgi:hypothetical protein
MVIGLVVVGAAGVGGYLLLNGRSAPESKPASPAPAPVDTVRTVRVPVATPRPAPTRRVERAKPQATPPLTPAPQGLLTINAEPFGEVYIDDVDLGQTPLVEHVVHPGSHKVRIERPGYKTVTETVQVIANNSVAKRYTLFPE